MVIALQILVRVFGTKPVLTLCHQQLLYVDVWSKAPKLRQRSALPHPAQPYAENCIPTPIVPQFSHTKYAIVMSGTVRLQKLLLPSDTKYVAYKSYLPMDHEDQAPLLPTNSEDHSHQPPSRSRVVHVHQGLPRWWYLIFIFLLGWPVFVGLVLGIVFGLRAASIWAAPAKSRDSEDVGSASVVRRLWVCSGANIPLITADSAI
ncbi:hypothetical protein EXIGLDRAFT_705344 [Exidia glandulosa HHB12029]|uniref:Uncharacterized protein n=1 Tax=Exidia glandulosa HHB12029 TaxID=1314781 RepID=A0A166AZR3_EXIGL|nr:hypothetical protein EXIGLDRAFT_705344 [Exidia glandulosa HHB12029]